jgi:hypothetical protein
MDRLTAHTQAQGHSVGFLFGLCGITACRIEPALSRSIKRISQLAALTRSATYVSRFPFPDGLSREAVFSARCHESNCAGRGDNEREDDDRLHAHLGGNRSAIGY